MKIKELAVKAGMTKEGNRDRLDYRKFAELIISQCEVYSNQQLRSYFGHSTARNPSASIVSSKSP